MWLSYGINRISETTAKEMGAIPEKGGKLSEALANLGWEAKVEGPDDADIEDGGAGQDAEDGGE